MLPFNDMIKSKKKINKKKCWNEALNCCSKNKIGIQTFADHRHHQGWKFGFQFYFLNCSLRPHLNNSIFRKKRFRASSFQTFLGSMSPVPPSGSHSQRSRDSSVIKRNPDFKYLKDWTVWNNYSLAGDLTFEQRREEKWKRKNCLQGVVKMQLNVQLTWILYT